jgi:hypothetical protein
MSKRRNSTFNDDPRKELIFFLNWTSCVVMEQEWYAHILMSIFPLLVEAEAISTNIYVARNIRMLKRPKFAA